MMDKLAFQDKWIGGLSKVGNGLFQDLDDGSSGYGLKYGSYGLDSVFTVRIWISDLVFQRILVLGFQGRFGSSILDLDVLVFRNRTSLFC